MIFIYSKDKLDRKPAREKLPYYQKPTNYLYADITIQELADLISEGRTWRAGIYNKNIRSFSKANVTGASIIALDFDSCSAHPQEIVQFAESIALKPTLYYFSFSQGVKPGYNFRILWVLDNPISAIQYENVYPLFLEAFKDFEPDKSTKDCSRLWFGTNTPATILDQVPVSLSSIGYLGVADRLKQGVPLWRIQQKDYKKTLCSEYFNDNDGELQQLAIYKGWYEELRVRC